MATYIVPVAADQPAVQLRELTYGGELLSAGNGLPVTLTAGGSADIVATGTLSAAQATVGTPVVGGTVSITLGTGQATVEAALTGTFNAGTTVLFEGTEDTGVTSNWFPMFGQDTSVQNPTNISSIVGGASKLIRIPSMGYTQVRVRANPFAGGDSVTVRLVASVAGSGIAGALSTNDGTFAKETGGVLGATADAAVTTNTTGSLSAKLRGLVAILADMWDSTNHWLQIKVMNGNANGQATMTNSSPVVIASNQSAVPISNTPLSTIQFDGNNNIKMSVRDASNAIVFPSPAALSDAFANPTTTQLAALGFVWNGTTWDRHKGDNTGEARVSLYGKSSAAGDTAAIFDSTGRQLIGRSTTAVYSLASTATTSSSNSGDLTVGAYTEISIDINTTAQTGTNPTIQFTYSRKGADGIYYALWQSTTLTAAANTISTSIGAGMAYNQSLGSTGQLKWVIGGTATPGFTFSANISGK